MSDRINWINCPDAPVYVLCEPHDKSIPPFAYGEHRGLLWGKGDRHLAGLRSFRWAVARVSKYYETQSPNGGCVAFDECTIVFEGKRPEAIRALIAHGANPNEISVWVSIEADVMLADTGDWGTSVAPPKGTALSGDRGYAETGFGGIARAGDDGYAETGSRGIALADEGGEAIAGEGGVAIVNGDHHGTATAADRGIAIGLGRHNILTAGIDGIAIALSNGKISVGDHGIALSRLGDSEVKGGEHSIVVGRVVSGGEGCLLVSRRWIPETNKVHTAFDFVGSNGLEPYVKYIAGTDGILMKFEDLEFQQGVASIGRLYDAFKKRVAGQNSEGSGDE